MSKFLLSILLFIMFLPGCGGGGTPGESQVSVTTHQATATPVSDSINGYVYAFNNDPESMAVITSELNPPVEGYNPVKDVHIALMSDPRISSITDEKGFFRLQGVPQSQIGNLTILQADHSKYLPVLFFSMSNQKASSADIVKLYILPEGASIIMGRIIQFTCFAEDSSNRLVNPETVNWQLEGNIGTIYQNGLFVATSAGKGKITATVAGIKKEASIEVLSTETTGSLKGTITYSDNSPAEGLFVTTNVTSWSSETDSQGKYSLQNIPSGNRILKVIKNGSVIHEANVLIEKEKENILDVKLDLLPPAPVILSLIPSGGTTGSEIQVTGNYFGSSGGILKLGGTVISAEFWSNSVIKFKIPSGAVTSSLTVNVNGQESNSVTLTVTSVMTPVPDIPYKGQLVNKSDDITVKRYTPGQLMMVYKNTGTVEWDPNTVYLGTSNPHDRTTNLYTQDDCWVSQTRIKMKETAPVTPGREATFIFLITPDINYWSSSQGFELKADVPYKDNPPGWFGENSFGEIYVTVTDQYYYDGKVTYKTPDITVKRYQTEELTVKIKNTGTLEWHPDIVHLGTSFPRDRTSHLYDGTWLSQNRIKMVQTLPVKPGEEAEFRFTIKPDSEYMTSAEAFEVVADGIYQGVPNKWFGGNSYMEIKVTVTE